MKSWWLLVLTLGGCGSSPTPPSPVATTPAVAAVADAAVPERAVVPCERGTLAGPVPVVLATRDRQIPHELAVAGDQLYWTDRAGGAVWRVATSGGEPVRVATGLEEPRELVATARAIYVATNAGTVRVDARSGEVHELLRGESLDKPVLGRDAIFVGEDTDQGLHGRIVRIDLATERATVLVDQISRVDALAVHGDALVFATTDGGLWQLPARGGVATQLATLPSPSIVLAVDDTRAYIQPFGSDDLLAVPRRGGPAVTILRGIGEVDSLTVDAEGLWWTSMPTGCVAGSRLDAPAARGLYGAQSRALGIASDAHALYWFAWTLGGGPMTVVRAPKPALRAAGCIPATEPADLVVEIVQRTLPIERAPGERRGAITHGGACPPGVACKLVTAATMTKVFAAIVDAAILDHGAPASPHYGGRWIEATWSSGSCELGDSAEAPVTSTDAPRFAAAFAAVAAVAGRFP